MRDDGFLAMQLRFYALHQIGLPGKEYSYGNKTKMINVCYLMESRSLVNATS